MTEYIKEIKSDELQIIEDLINAESLNTKTRVQHIVHKRFFLMDYIRKETSFTYEEIGDMFGGLDHSTVIHGIKKHNQFMEWNDKVYLRDIKWISHFIKEPHTIIVSTLKEDVMNLTSLSGLKRIQRKIKADKYST